MRFSLRIRRSTAAASRVARVLQKLKRDLDLRSLRERPAEKPAKVRK